MNIISKCSFLLVVSDNILGSQKIKTFGNQFNFENAMYNKIMGAKIVSNQRQGLEVARMKKMQISL